MPRFIIERNFAEQLEPIAMVLLRSRRSIPMLVSIGCSRFSAPIKRRPTACTKRPTLRRSARRRDG